VSVGKHTRRSAAFCLLLCCCVCRGVAAQTGASVSSSAAAHHDPPQASVNLHFVRSFASAQDVKQPHPVLDKTLDIIAGPADPVPRVDSLQLPSAVITDSSRHVFVADPGAKAVHIFDFARSKYGLLDAGGDRLGKPIALAVDLEGNLYVTNESSRTILIYNSAGKFRRQWGELRGGESYFDSPTGIAIDGRTGNLYVCDTRRNMVVAMNRRGQVVARIGKRGGGDQPGDFHFPTRAVVAGNELLVLDAGNSRIQVFDTTGHFRRATRLAFADHNTGLAVDRDLNIYVTDASLNAIQVFNREGRPLYTFDPAARAEGKVSRLSALWVSADNCLYVVDSGSRRVSVFQIGRKDVRQCR
jgi:DNA-binding beta-propeller fold protein YncE